jgi:diguanylate cyclase (GGDEF)-like protein
MTETGARTTTLLLVAPADADADLLRRLLRTSDPSTFEIARATGIADALSYLDTATPDCAVVDVDRPGAAGLDSIDALAVRSPGVALVVLTGRADDELGVATAKAGAVDCLSKGELDRRLLVASIRNAIVRRRLETSLDDVRNDAAEALVQHELHDPLTGLPNRSLLVDRLGHALSHLARVHSLVGVIHLDIDRFKLINDSLGHDIGDQLLVATATRLQDLVRPEDTLARIDGDEFVVLCEGLTDQAQAVVIADRICEAMAEPVAWDGGDLVISVSAGIALATSESVEVDSVLRDADAAMHRAKLAGRARSAVFAETMRVKAAGRLDIETSLRHAIANGDLRMHYQPIVTLADGQVLGHEALVRWDHPTRGLLGPDEFISIAEESGLIIPLGAWVLQEACRQAKRFQTRDPKWPRLTMSVNLSGGQLGQRDLVDLIGSALTEADLPSEDLQLEMTESVLMDDAPTTIKVLQSLKDLGVRLSIDDFGTGYSSLAYLRRFPVDVLKIDRTFVDGLGKDLEDSAIVAAVVNLADTLGFTTIAEGVETELQRDCLVGLGCTRAQGFLFARPVAAAEAEIALDQAAVAVGSSR